MQIFQFDLWGESQEYWKVCYAEGIELTGECGISLKAMFSGFESRHSRQSFTL
jgi:hypothetical protein